MHDREETQCVYCGEPAFVALLEIWSGHEFMLETCCADKHDEIVAGMAEDPDWARALLRQLDAEVLTGHSLRRAADDSGGFVLDWNLDLRPVSFAAARAFVDRHHAHCGGPAAWRFGAAVWNGWTLLGVVMVGNPVARAYATQRMVEVNRLCVRRDLPPSLRWNACSMLYGWAAREAEQRGFVKIITYTREDEDGASLRAAGWTKETRVRGRGWHSAARNRRDDNAWIDKDRWSRTLRSPPAARPRGVDPVPPFRIPTLNIADDSLQV
jgi:hypothetical protein